MSRSVGAARLVFVAAPAGRSVECPSVPQAESLLFSGGVDHR